jgi:Polyketide cyclase / dehydrase and lipid transport
MEPSMRETFAFHLNAPVDEVFDLCADFKTLTPILSPGTEIAEVTPGPVGVGTAFSYVDRRSGIVGRSEVLEYSPPHTFRVVTVANGFRPHTTVTVVEAADGGGSTVRVYSDGKPYAPSRWLRPFSWIAAPLLRRALAKANDRFVKFARETLEAKPAR